MKNRPHSPHVRPLSRQTRCRTRFESSRRFLARLASRRAQRRFAALTAVLLAGGLGFSTISHADDTWTGGGTTPNWNDAGNWNSGTPDTVGFGTLTFSTSTNSPSNDNITALSENKLLMTTTGSFEIDGIGAISLYDNGGTQAKIENNSSSTSGTFTLNNATINFAATSGAAWGEINAVTGNLLFGTSNTLNVNGSQVVGIKMYGGGHTTTFNNTVAATGKYFSTTATGDTVAIGGTFTSGNFDLMNSGVLNLTGSGFTTSALRLGGDYGGDANAATLSLGATFNLVTATGGQTFNSIIAAVTGNTSGALVINSQNTSGTNTLGGNFFLDSNLAVNSTSGGTLLLGAAASANTISFQSPGTAVIRTLTLGGTGIITVNEAFIGVQSGAQQLVINGGVVTLAANNSGSGANLLLNNIQGGTLSVSSAANIGVPTLTGSTTYPDKVLFGSTAGGNTATLQATGTFSYGAMGTNAYGFGIQEAATGNTANIAVIDVASGQTLTLAGAISDNAALNGTTGTVVGKLQKIDTGTLVLGVASTYTGGTNINGGIVQIGNANALGTTGTISFGGGTLQYGTGINTDLSARFGTVGQSYSIDTVANNVTFATAFGGAAGNGNTLTKAGAGVLTLTGANTYTGGTTVNAGAIYLGNATGAGTGTITLAGTAALLYNNVNFNNPLNVTGTNYIVTQGGDGDGAHTGALTGSGTLTIGSVVVNGTTYTSVSSFKYNGSLAGFTGTFIDNVNTNVIFQGSANAGSSSAKFQINGSGFNATNSGSTLFNMGELSGSSGGNFASGGTLFLSIGTLNTNSTYAGKFGTTTNLSKIGTGTLTLSGIENGSTVNTINAGAIQFAKTTALENSATPTAAQLNVKSGATAAFNVGGTGEFTAANISSILTNVSVASSATSGLQAGSFIGLDTTNAGGSFTYGTAIANSTGANGGAVGLTKLGSGALSLTATSTYTGATTVAAGTLSLTGALGNTAVTVNSGATLAGGGNGTTTGLIGGTVNALGGSSISLATPGTQIKSMGAITLGNTGTYNSTNFSTLAFTLGGSNTAEALNTGGALTANNVFVSLSSIANGTYTLANYASVAGGYDFSLSSTAGNVLTQNIGRNTETLTVGATTLTLNVTGLANPNVAYFNAAVSSVWNDTSNATKVNFSTNKAGTTDAGQVPGGVTDVILVADNLAGTAVTSTLGANTTINSLNFNSNATSNTIAADGSTLTINALADSNTDTGGGYTGNTAGTGIAIASGAGAVTINAGVNLGNSQTWTNNSANLFTVGGAIAGTAASGTQTLTLANTGTGTTVISGAISSGAGGGAVALTVNNTGTGGGLVTTLTGASTYSGATTVTAGTLQLGDGTTGHDGTITNSASVSLASGTTLNLNPFGTTAAYNNPITGAGKVTMTGTGTYSLSGTSSYTGGTTVSAGTLATTDGVNAFGTNGAGTLVAIGSAGTVLINSTGTNTYNDTFSGSGLLKVAFNTNGGDTIVNNFNNFTGTLEIASANGGNNKLQIQSNSVGTNLSTATLKIDNGGQYFTSSNVVNFGTINIVGTGNGEVRGAIRLNGNGTTTAAATTGILGGNVFLQGDTTIGSEGGTLTGNVRNFAGTTGTQTLTFGTTNASAPILLSGNISNGAGTLALTQFAQTTTLSGTNTYTGATTINGGTLKAGSTGAFSSGSDVTFANTSGAILDTTGFSTTVGSLAGGGTTGGSVTLGAATLTTGGTNTSTSYAGIISGTGGVTKTGTGTQTFTGANTYTGTTAINAGTLLVNGNQPTATGNVNVASGGTLGGTGTVGGTTTVATGGTITGATNGPINTAGAIGTLSFTNALTINGTYVADISSSTSDKLSLTGTNASGVLNVTNATLNLNGTISTGIGYVLATYASITGTFANVTYNTGALPAGEYLVYGATSLTLVPEPGTWAGGLLLVGTFGFSQRRRLRAWHSLSKSA